MNKVIRLLILTAIAIVMAPINQSWGSYHLHSMGHSMAQADVKGLKKQLEILWPKKGEVVNAKEIEVKIGVAEELKDMVGHIHVYLNGKRLDHASIKEDTLLLWDLKDGENKLEIVLSKGEAHEEHASGKIIKDSVTFKVKTK
jgi:hypothetical protein